MSVDEYDWLKRRLTKLIGLLKQAEPIKHRYGVGVKPDVWELIEAEIAKFERNYDAYVEGRSK